MSTMSYVRLGRKVRTWIVWWVLCGGWFVVLVLGWVLVLFFVWWFADFFFLFIGRAEVFKPPSVTVLDFFTFLMLG